MLGGEGIIAVNSLPMVCDSDSYEFRGLCSQGMAASIHKYRLHSRVFHRNLELDEYD